MDPVTEVRGRFADQARARAVAEALNAWFQWIATGGGGSPPSLFEPLGASTSAYAWALGEDVDWELGPHARTSGAEVVIDLETHETHLRLAGLLRALGALSAWVVREPVDD